MATDNSIFPLFVMITIGIATNLMLIYTYLTH